MKKINDWYGTTYKMSTEEAIDLLDKGRSLTADGKDLDTFKKVGDMYELIGIHDRGPTILSREDLIAEKRFEGRKWSIDLM